MKLLRVTGAGCNFTFLLLNNSKGNSHNNGNSHGNGSNHSNDHNSNNTNSNNNSNSKLVFLNT